MRVVQFTDTHLVPETGKKLYGVDTYKSLGRALDTALSLDPKPEFIFVTGDLSEDGSAQSYARLKQIFQRIKIPVFAVPGNHDDLETMKKAFEGSAIQLTAHANVGSWLSIFVNTLTPGKSYGSITESTLREVESSLSMANGRPVVISLHHPPHSPCPSPGCKLQNEEDLLNLLRQHKNVKMILSGHMHEEIEQDFAHIKLLTSPSTFAQGKHPEHNSEKNVEDFWASHSLDITKQGFRVLDLFPSGEYDTKICIC